MEITPEKMAEMLTGCGLEVESINPFEIEEDMIFSIGLTPNRSDATSHIGVARDLVAVSNNFGSLKHRTPERLKLSLPDVSKFKPGNKSRIIPVVVENPEACIRYSGLTITGVTVKPSPIWMCNRLMSVGIRPINNIVDITNFVLMELGQPLHPFDADKIEGQMVIVKKYPEGTPFVTLDDTQRRLTGQDLMISDRYKPMCIGGVFGGMHSGITENTKAIFLESACFDPQHIRQTSRYHGLQTEASFRFERGTDPEMTLFALKRAALLILELAGGIIASDVEDVYPTPIKNQEIKLSFRNLDRLTGKSIDRTIVRDILGDLGIKIKHHDREGILVGVPPFKVEVTREADLIEEILRIFGYSNIEGTSDVTYTPSSSQMPNKEKIKELISDYLSNNGFQEIINNSFTASRYHENNPVYPMNYAVRMLNPLSRDLDVLRQTLLYGGIESIVYNINRKNHDLRFYEFGTVFNRTQNLRQEDPVPGFHETEQLALFMTGRSRKENWNTSDDLSNLFEMKGYIQSIFQKTGINPELFKTRKYQSPLITQGLEYLAGDQSLFVLGTLNESFLKSMDCKQSVLYAACDWKTLLTLVPHEELQFTELPRYPEVRRDLALLLDQSVTFNEIRDLAYKTEPILLKKIGLFDVYEGDNLEHGKKSYALSFILRDDQKTLTDQEIDRVMDHLIKTLTKNFHAQIR
jgi:phenylalanyl-tRNA synthetase beta chain